MEHLGGGARLGARLGGEARPEEGGEGLGSVAEEEEEEVAVVVGVGTGEWPGMTSSSAPFANRGLLLRARGLRMAGAGGEGGGEGGRGGLGRGGSV